MLIHEEKVLRPYPILDLLAAAGGRTDPPRELLTGVYEIGHFGSSDFLADAYERYPDVSVGPYGVCDTVRQLLDACPELEKDPQREFVVTVTPIRRADESPSGGWRWHKWGAYIGTQCPQHEYLYDDTHIDEVLVYHIYEHRRALVVTDGEIAVCEHRNYLSVGHTSEGMGHVLVKWCPDCGALKRTMTNWKYTDYPWEMPKQQDALAQYQLRRLRGGVEKLIGCTNIPRAAAAVRTTTLATVLDLIDAQMRSMPEDPK